MAHKYDICEMAAALSQLDIAVGQKLVRGEPRRPVAARMPIQPLQPSGEGPPSVPTPFDVVKVNGLLFVDPTRDFAMAKAILGLLLE